MTTNTWAAETQSTTLITADHYREPWSREELEFVREFTEVDTDEDLAVALGRSLYAIWNIQHRMRNGETVDMIYRRPRERRATTTCMSCFTEVSFAGTCLC